MWVIGLAYVHRDNSVAYGIYNDDTMVGMVILLELNNKYSFSEFFIADDYQNQGFAKEAVKCIIDKFKKERKYSNIMIFVHESNKVALHLYEKSGFKITGDPTWSKYFYVMEIDI